MKFIFLSACLLGSVVSFSQSRTTEALEKRFKDNSLPLTFYHNTLRMINLAEDPALDELIKDIEKVKFLLIRKDASSFTTEVYQRIVADYRNEAFEEMMTSRHGGNNFDIFMRDGRNKGMLVLVNSADQLLVLDIVGSIALNKVMELYTFLDKSSEVGREIHSFLDEID